jgi:hypothetical protein
VRKRFRMSKDYEHRVQTSETLIDVTRNQQDQSRHFSKSRIGVLIGSKGR